MTATSNEPAATLIDRPPEPQLTPEQLVLRRRFCSWLELWRDCAAPTCRRAHACVGDPTPCLCRGWARLSEVGKVWAYAGLAAVEHGLTARNAAVAADLALLHHVKRADRLPRHPPRRRRGVLDEADAQTARPDYGNEA